MPPHRVRLQRGTLSSPPADPSWSPRLTTLFSPSRRVGLGHVGGEDYDGRRWRVGVGGPFRGLAELGMCICGAW
ncbi:unnamed protein product [Linum trigynum]|uniref:Uncharacterized protein n=1 Tax=Linum trigynum TaxID=586398 RepID=A0AAV2G6S7_9ROSI